MTHVQPSLALSSNIHIPWGRRSIVPCLGVGPGGGGGGGGSIVLPQIFCAETYSSTVQLISCIGSVSPPPEVNLLMVPWDQVPYSLGVGLRGTPWEVLYPLFGALDGLSDYECRWDVEVEHGTRSESSRPQDPVESPYASLLSQARSELTHAWLTSLTSTSPQLKLHYSAAPSSSHTPASRAQP